MVASSQGAGNRRGEHETDSSRFVHCAELACGCASAVVYCMTVPPLRCSSSRAEYDTKVSSLAVITDAHVLCVGPPVGTSRDSGRLWIGVGRGRRELRGLVAGGCGKRRNDSFTRAVYAGGDLGKRA